MTSKSKWSNGGSGAKTTGKLKVCVVHRCCLMKLFSQEQQAIRRLDQIKTVTIDNGMGAGCCKDADPDDSQHTQVVEYKDGFFVFVCPKHIDLWTAHFKKPSSLPVSSKKRKNTSSLKSGGGQAGSESSESKSGLKSHDIVADVSTKSKSKSVADVKNAELMFVRYFKLAEKHVRGADYVVGYDTYWLQYTGNEAVFEKLKQIPHSSAIPQCLDMTLINETTVDIICSVPVPKRVVRQFCDSWGDTLFNDIICKKVLDDNKMQHHLQENKDDVLCNLNQYFNEEL